MEKIENAYNKVKSLAEVDNAVRFDVPLTPGHEFYTDFPMSVATLKTE